MTPVEISDLRKQLREDNDRYPDRITRMPDEYWNDIENNPPSMRALWRSKNYIVQVHEDNNGFGDGYIRLAIARSDLDKDTGRPLNDIPFKVLQQIKHDMGYGDADATIVLPKDSNWADFGGFTTIYIHPFPLDYGVKKPDVEETTSGLIIIP